MRKKPVGLRAHFGLHLNVLSNRTVDVIVLSTTMCWLVLARLMNMTFCLDYLHAVNLLDVRKRRHFFPVFSYLLFIRSVEKSV